MNWRNHWRAGFPRLVRVGVIAGLGAATWMGVGGSALVWAQATQPVVSAPADNGAPAAATAQVAGSSVKLYVGQSRVINSRWPVKRISVARPDVADVQMITPDSIQIQGKASGQTEVTMWNAQEQSAEVIVEVNADLRGLAGILNRLFPPAQLQLEQLDGMVIVRGTIGRTEDAAQLHTLLDSMKVKYLDTTRLAGVHQVQLQVRVAEVSRSALRAMGINAFAAGSDAFGGITLGSSAGPLAPISVGVPKGAPAGPNLPFQFLGDTNVPSAATLFAGFPNSDFQVFVQALEENQYLQTLAEPTLVALSGEEATFLAGGEFPIPVPQTSGGSSTTITITYKEFGVRLAFRPTVMGDGKIRLLVAPEVSELSDVGSIELQGFRVPSLLTRKVQTTVEMSSGQTFGLAGLISRNAGSRVSKVPGLGDLPVLGALFRSVRYNQGQTELLVLVTPSLVEPLSVGQQPPLPGETDRAPDAWELYALGRIEGKAPARLHPNQSDQLKQLGLDRLKGPGAWVSYGRQSPVAAAP